MADAKYELLDRDFAEVSSRSNQIDPNNELCWLSLTVGWAIAKGLNTVQAIDYAHHIRYETDLG